MNNNYRYSHNHTGQLEASYDLVRQAIRIALDHGASIDQIAQIANEEVSLHSQRIMDIEQTPGPYPNTPKLIVKGVDE
jgi:hypothetical protein